MLSNEDLAIKGLMICSFAALLISILFLSDTAKFLSLLMVVASAFLKKAWEKEWKDRHQHGGNGRSSIGKRR